MVTLFSRSPAPRRAITLVNLAFRRLSIILALLVWLSPLPAAAAPAMYDQSPRVAFAALQARASGQLTASWHPRTGIPEWLAPTHPDLRLPLQASPALQSDPVATAFTFLDQQRQLFGLRSPQAELQLLRIEPDHQLGYASVRLAQVHAGVPVFGRQLVVHVAADGGVAAVNGQFEPGIQVAVTPQVSPATAEQAALADLLEFQLEPAERARVQPEVLSDRTRLMVYVDRRGQATLTWYVTIMTERPLGQWRYFVHAGRPRVVHRFDSLSAARRRQTYTAGNRTRVPGRLLIDEGERSRDQVAQAAHDGAGTVYDYFFTNFRRDSIDGRGMPIVSTVHFGSDPEDSENAAWISEAQQMIYGDGGTLFRPLPYALDVIAHELTHGVIDFTAQLIYEGQSGALNESYADVFGALIDRDDWRIGEDVTNAPPYPVPYLRDMADPNLRGSYNPRQPLGSAGQPSHMREYANLPLSRRTDNGGVHVNSGIPNRAAFLVAESLGRDRMAAIYYRTMTQYLTPDSDFLDAARATVRAAQELYGNTEASAVRQAFAQVGLDVGGADTLPAPPPETSPIPEPAGEPDPQEPLPAGCTELVVNGGFENDAAWSISDEEVELISDELPYRGARSAWLGGTDQESIQYLYQDIRIPANATQVTLQYQRLIHQEFAGFGALLAADADFTVVIATTNGDPVATVEELSSAQGDDSWQQARADLTQFAGKTVRLVFASQNPRGNISSFFVDDVQLLGCTGGSAPQAPPTSQQNLVYLQGTITNADTRRGIAGAQVFVLKPGLSASRAVADDTLTEDEVLTMGVTDDRGGYQTRQPVTRGQTYSVIVVARGFRPIVADNGLEVPGDATNPYQVDATLRRGR